MTLDRNEPKPVVRTFYEALYAGDIETANSLLHPDSPAPRYTEEAVAPLTDYSHEIAGLEIVQDNGGTVVLEFELRLSIGGEQQRTDQVTIEVRMSDGKWRVWNAER